MVGVEGALIVEVSEVLHGWCRRSVDCGGFYSFTWLV